MNRIESEDFVYKSFLKAEKYQNYNAKDSSKRRPDLTRQLIRDKSCTPCVLVTGSKGKGSVAVMISQILQTRYKVGLMTSPHISSFCERFRINGVCVSDDDFAACMTAVQPDVDAVENELPLDVCISPMGIQAAFALEYFNTKKTDFNIFECGKGVRFDDVNNIIHQYSVVNSIFLEHTRELGDTLEAIAEDKAFIINGEQKCVYVAEQTEGVMAVLKKRAQSCNVPIKVYGVDFFAENIRYTSHGMEFDVDVDGVKFRRMSVPLLGVHQARNCALAMAFCNDVLGTIDEDAARNALAVIEWPGRMEILSENPFVMLDACINSASCANVKDVLDHLGITRASVIIGIPDDKDFLGVAEEMHGYAEKIILTRSQNPHYVFTDQQRTRLLNEGIEAIWTESFDEALTLAEKGKLPIIILGTTSLVAEVLENRPLVHN